MYLDPSFAGMLLQILLALVVVSGAIIFSMKRKARSIVTKNSYKKQSTVSNKSSNYGVIDTLSD